MRRARGGCKRDVGYNDLRLAFRRGKTHLKAQLVEPSDK
jgi:hypothetical protein